MIEPEISSITPEPADKKKIWKIWWVAIVLALVTAAEFFVALQFPETWKDFKIFLFIGMTFVKAGYIVMEFMHLGHEQKSLMWTILIPCAFVVWLLGALLYKLTQYIKLSTDNESFQERIYSFIFSSFPDYCFFVFKILWSK